MTSNDIPAVDNVTASPAQAVTPPDIMFYPQIPMLPNANIPNAYAIIPHDGS
jgi:hypothetical protein